MITQADIERLFDWSKPVEIPPPGNGMFADVEFDGPEDRERCRKFLDDINAICREDEMRTKARLRRLRHLLDQRSGTSKGLLAPPPATKFRA